MSLKDALTLSPLAFLVGAVVYWFIGQAIAVPDICLSLPDAPPCTAPRTWGGLPAAQAPTTYAIAVAVTTFVVEYIVKIARSLRHP
jgi:hypothetical protein